MNCYFLLVSLSSSFPFLCLSIVSSEKTKTNNEMKTRNNHLIVSQLLSTNEREQSSHTNRQRQTTRHSLEQVLRASHIQHVEELKKDERQSKSFRFENVVCCWLVFDSERMVRRMAPASTKEDLMKSDLTLLIFPDRQIVDTHRHRMKLP